MATYTVFGYRRTALGHDHSLGFTGQWPDRVSGSYLLGNGYRAYSPILMRFASCDSLSPFGRGGLNGYSYCGGDPVNCVDPSGHWGVLTALGSLVGFFTGTGGLALGTFASSRRAQQVGTASIATAVVAAANVNRPEGPALAGTSVALGFTSIKAALTHSSRANAVSELNSISKEILLRAGLPSEAASRSKPASLAELAALSLPAQHAEKAPEGRLMYSRPAGRILDQGPQNARFAQQFITAPDKIQFLETVEKNPDAFEVKHLSKQLREHL